MEKQSESDLSRRTFFGAGALTVTAASLNLSANAATTENGVARYHNQLTFSTGANIVRGISSGLENEIYISADRDILVFSKEGTLQKRISIKGEPSCAAVGKSGVLHVGVGDHVEIFSSSGKQIAKWKSPSANVQITDIALKKDGSVFVSDGGNRVIWHLDKEGNVLHQLDHKGKKFATPRDFFPIAVQNNGELAAANPGRHRIENYSNSGKLDSVWGEKSRSGGGFGGCCNPISFAIMSDGSYITAEGGLPRIKRFDSKGNFQEIIASPEALEANARNSHENPDHPATCHSGGLEVAVDSQDRVLLLDRVTAEVSILSI